MQPLGNILPADFDGIFRFTNPTEEDFVGRWAKKDYIFPAMKTSPMIIVDATPIEIQNIRKKFAKELAEREFFKSKKAKAMTEKRGELNSIHQAASYSDDDLKPWIQKCLEPLPTASALIQDAKTPNIEEKLSRNQEGEIVTTVIDKRTSLRKKALEA